MVFDNLLMGDLPWTSLLEIVVRTLILYLYTYFLLRLVGKRVAKEFTVLEIIIIIALGSAVGDAMIYPVEVPLLPSLIVITIVVVLEQTIAILVNTHRKLEDFIEGKSVLVIKDGLVKNDKLKKQRFSTEDIYEKLRQQGVENLGQIRRAFLEKSGNLSVFSQAVPQKGLPILPPDEGDPQHFEKGENVPKESDYACWNCGEIEYIKADNTFPKCPRCKGREWVETE